MVGNAVKLFDKRKQQMKTLDMHEGFCTQVSEYKCNMFRVAKGILHNDMDAEDAVSEAILKAYSNLHRLRDINRFRPWIMKILVNESYTISNRRKKLVSIEGVEIKEEQDFDTGRELWNTVNCLEEEFRIVTLLFYYEDLSLKDIAKILDLPMGTVKSRLSRARNKLKEILSKEGSF